jgi:hypothetical protein
MRLYSRDPLFALARPENVWVPSVITIAAATSTRIRALARLLALVPRSLCDPDPGQQECACPSLLPVRTALHHVPRARRPFYLGRAPMSSAAGPPLAAAASRTRHKRFPSPPALEQPARSACTQAALVLGWRANVLRRWPAARSSPAASPPRPVHHVDICCCARCAFELQLLALRRAARCHGPC